MQYDLHSHSTASDGTLTPTELVQQAKAGGVDVLALTDHDTTEGLAEAAVEAARLELELVNGVEISVTWAGHTIHLVGLRFDPNAPLLQQGLQRLREFRAWRAEEIGRRLAKHGIADAYVAARRLSNGRLISRTHFARHLVEAGHAESVHSVFKRFLVRGKPGYVPGQWASLDEAICWIRSAGGQVVLAHPARYDLTQTKQHRLIREFKDLGGAALEVISGSHHRDDNQLTAQQAKAFNLLASAGSDFHDPKNPWIELGKLPPLPSDCIPIWHDWNEAVMN